MRHPTEEQLVWFWYGEARGAERIREHVEECEACREALRRIESALAQVDAMEAPERGEEYGAEVWARVRPRLAAAAPERKRLWSGLLTARRWALGGAMAALVIGAFVAGRFSSAPEPAEQAAAQPASVRTRERILLVAVGDHLERSQMVLMELANTSGEGGVDITGEQERAENLLAENRLYRQTAAGADQPGVASVLEDLERTLLEIAHSPSRPSSEEFDALRRRIEARGILFKVRVIDSKLEKRVSGAS